MSEQTDHQQAITETLRRRHQDAAIRAARLLAQSKDAQAYAAQLEREYYEVRHPLTPAELTPKERHDTLTALHVAIDIIDNGEDG